MKQSRRSAPTSNSSSSPYASSSSTSSNSSLNSSSGECFQFSPLNSLSGNGCVSSARELLSSKSDHVPPLFLPASPSQLQEQRLASDDERMDIQDDYIYRLPELKQESPNFFLVESHRARKWMVDGLITTAGEVSDSESSTGRPRQTLAELMCSSDKEEVQSLLNSAYNHRLPSPHRNSTSQPTKSLLVQALCKGRKSTSDATLNPGSKTPPRLPHSFNPHTPPRVHRSNVVTAPRSKCTAPSPLRKSSCCKSATNQIIDCTFVVRSKSSGSDIPHRGVPHDNFLTKSKSLRSNQPGVKSLNRAGKSYSKVNNLCDRCPSRNMSSGRRSVSSSMLSSVNSSSNDSIVAAMERYQKNSKAEQKRRSSYLPYKSALLSFFPIPWLWSQLRGGHHHHHHHHQHSNVAY